MPNIYLEWDWANWSALKNLFQLYFVATFSFSGNRAHPLKHALGLRRSEVYNQFFDYAAFKGWICESSLLYRWYESQRSHACCTFNQNSGEFPKRRDNLSAIAGLIARRSLNISFIVWRDTPKAFAMEAVLRP